MNQKTLIGLAVAALVAIVVAVFVNHANRPRSESDDVADAKSDPLVPSLRDHVNDVGKVVITGAGGTTIATLARGADGWTVADKNFAADTGKLRELLLKIADAKLVEPKTANKDKYATLGVDDVFDKDAKGVGIELDGLGSPVKLIVGVSNPRSGTFVRRAGEAQSWLASGSINVDKKPENWLRKDLVDIAAPRVRSVTIERPDGKTVRVAKDAEGDANFKLADVPKGREAGSEFTVNGIASTLGGLRFDDVVPSKDAPLPDKPLKARYAMFDGLVVDVTAWAKDGKDYATFAASVDRDRAERHADATAAKASDASAKGAASNGATTSDGATSKDDTANVAATGDTKTGVAASAKASSGTREQKLSALDAEAADLNKRVGGWTFVLPAYKYANIDKLPDDLLKPLDEKKSEAKGDAAKSAKKAVPAKKSG
jgi:hypothetical protein